jgi:deoxyadenosine/deoxycytidine kinase
MLIFLEANIGGGKTSFAERLKEFQNLLGFKIALEPVDEWLNTKDTSGKNILQHYYENPTKVSFAFQMNSFISRCKRLEDFEHHKTDIIMERSVYSDYHCFAKTCFENKTMTEMEYIIYKKWFEWLTKSFNIQSSGYIYIRTTPEECLKRIEKRSRNSECSIPLEYLQTLHKKHDDWLLKDENVLVLDGNKNFLDDDKIFKDYLKQMIQFINKIKQKTQKTKQQQKTNIHEQIDAKCK